MLESVVSFPNMGLDFLKNIHLNRTAFSIGSIGIYWYGIIITLGIIAAFVYVLLKSKKCGIASDDIYDMAIFTIISAVICARLYYVLTSLNDYIKDDFIETLKAIVNIRNGGLAIYGAIIGGALAAYIVCLVKKINIRKMFDILFPAVMIGQIIGRWGNFVNAEAYGDIQKFCFFGFEIATPNAQNLPWIMEIQKGFTTITAHPTFLYESLWNLIGLIIILTCFRKKKYDGQISLFYLAYYGAGRTIIEGFRADSLFVGNIRVSQFLGFVCFITCTALLIIFAVKGKALGLKVGEPYKKKTVDVDGVKVSGDGGEYADEVNIEEDTAEEDELEKEEPDDTEETPEQSEKTESGDKKDAENT